MKAKLIAVTQPTIEEANNAKELIAFCARVSNPNNQSNMDTADKLLDYLMKYKHWSPLEMANAVVEVEAPRDIARQLLRHRSFSFQEFCVSGDSLISMVLPDGKIRRKPIKELYRLQESCYASRANWGVRLYNEETKLLEVANIKEVFSTGVKPCFRLTLENSHSKKGKSIVATKEHKFLTHRGWKRLEEITKDDFVAENGVPLYRDVEWLKRAKDASIISGTGVTGIAEMANVSYHTIRKWLRVHGLQFTAKEVSSYTPIWNKSLPAEEQPMYGKFHGEESRSKMRESSIQSFDSSFYSTGDFTNDNMPFRKMVAKWARGFVSELLIKQDHKCALTGEVLNKSTAHVDHILPVYAHPDKAFNKDNLQVISAKVHKEKTLRETSECRQTVRYKKVASIEFVGDVETYDMEINAPSHNYVANGIVTHNSQRYADVSQLDNSFCLREARMQDDKNRQNSVEIGDETEDDRLLKSEWLTRQQEVLDVAKENYLWALNAGLAKEVARVVLPEGLTMSRLYVNGTIRSWVHYLQVRTEEGVTQKEHVVLANLIAEQVSKAFPISLTKRA